MTKNPQKDTINAIVPGAKDANGNEVAHVLAAGNEYVIYEIKHPDINYRLRVFIDGHTDESEKVLIDRFAAIKQKYIAAKGLLYRSPNFGVMKNRVAHALASALSTEAIDSNREFDELLRDLNAEAITALKNRLAYVGPTIAVTVLISATAGILTHFRAAHPHWFHLSFLILAASLGSTVSILVGTRNLHFEEYNDWKYYLFIGFVRVFLAYAAGAIIYVAIRSKYILPNALDADIWKAMAIVIVAAFSETLVPNILGRIEKRDFSDEQTT